jgi:hypothetical protein
LLRVFDLTQNADLHVVNKQRDPLRIAHLFERLRYAQSEDVFHIYAENAC